MKLITDFNKNVSTKDLWRLFFVAIGINLGSVLLLVLISKLGLTYDWLEYLLGFSMCVGMVGMISTHIQIGVRNIKAMQDDAD
jgi:hypothetical protein